MDTRSSCLLSPQAKGSRQSRPGYQPGACPAHDPHTTPDLALSRPGTSQRLPLSATFPSGIVHEGAARCCRPPNKHARALPTCAKPHLSRRKGFVSLWPVNVFVCLNSVQLVFIWDVTTATTKKKAKPGFLNTNLGAEIHICNPSVG